MLTAQISEKGIDLEKKNKEGETRGKKSYHEFTETTLLKQRRGRQETKTK